MKNKLTNIIINTNRKINKRKDLFWFGIWIFGILFVFLWDFIFLNKPALNLVGKAAINTSVISVFVMIFSLIFGWITAMIREYYEENNKLIGYYFNFIIDLIRSVPQIILILLGYIILTHLIKVEIIKSTSFILLFISFIISGSIFIEIADVINERINFFKRKDFYNSLIVNGVSPFKIINVEILIKNSLSNIFHKVISVFGITIFLQVSIDFIISVGLSSQVSLMNFPVTIGSLLAKLDSKQDILALGKLFSDPFYFYEIITTHLQGITLAFLTVFTLFCLYKISTNYMLRKL